MVRVSVEESKPARADAQRNRRQLLDVAKTVIAEQGTSASLRDIARKSGVGLGTLYRNFPTREALLEELLREGFDRLAESAHALESSADPFTALQAWLKDFVQDASTYRGLSSSLMSTLSSEESELHASCLRMRSAGGRLLKLAQTAGDVRADVSNDDVYALANAVAWIAEQSIGFAERRDHLFSLVIDAIRPQTKAPGTSAGLRV